MNEVILKPISREANAGDVLDLLHRAADYVVLEVGHTPDAAYVEKFFTARPPDVPPEGLMHFAVMLETAQAGLVCVAEGYEFADDWWLGLVLMDPAYRGRGLGHAALNELKAQAKARNIAMLKLAVLDVNLRARKFWHREGFIFHRHAPASPGSDGHDRTVLKYVLRAAPERPF